MISKNNVDDLDSFYFFDKINMRSNSASLKKVPKLDFNVMKMKLNKNVEIQSQICNQQNVYNESYNNNNQICEKKTMNNQKLSMKKVNLKIFLIEYLNFLNFI